VVVAVSMPHPIPYQGSKRRLASRILETTQGRQFRALYEPFAGSGAITLAAAHHGRANRFVLSDTLGPLAELWERILADPEALAADYEAIWSAQFEDPAPHYLAVRDRFNATGGAARLLYLLARCVKNAPRFNKDGHFNQSADHRRRGMRPAKMRREIAGTSALLARRATIRCVDFEEALASAAPGDLVYLDPPWEGISTGTDTRYHAGLSRERLISALELLASRGVPYLLSYDGKHGTKEYGEPLPDSIGARRRELDAGRSSQATLNGQSVMTYESLYISELLTAPPAPHAQVALKAA